MPTFIVFRGSKIESIFSKLTSVNCSNLPPEYVYLLRRNTILSLVLESTWRQFLIKQGILIKVPMKQRLLIKHFSVREVYFLLYFNKRHERDIVP